MSGVWATKHRPSSWDDIVGQDSIVEEMRTICSGSPMQHFLFHSVEPGTGKTTVARLLASSLDYTLHTFNASSKRTRGIEFIEEDVIPLSQNGMWETIILLDEADRLTIQAQDALKGVIENATCYFILTCNDLSKVSPWLQSRCQLRTFAPIEIVEMVSRLIKVSTSEGLIIPSVHVERIAKGHLGDLRNAIGALQTYNSLPQSGRELFTRSLSAMFSPKDFLRLCAKEQAVEQAVKMTEAMQTRMVIRDVFHYAVNSDASTAGKMRVIEASVVGERDLLSGVHEDIVRWNYCRMLASRDS